MILASAMHVTALGWVAIIVYVLGVPVGGIVGARYAMRSGEGPGMQRLMALEAAAFWPVVFVGWCVWGIGGVLVAVAGRLERRR